MRWVKRALPLCSSEAGAKPVFGDRDEHDMWCIASQPLAQHRFACAPAAMPWMAVTLRRTTAISRMTRDIRMPIPRD